MVNGDSVKCAQCHCLLQAQLTHWPVQNGQNREKFQMAYILSETFFVYLLAIRKENNLQGC